MTANGIIESGRISSFFVGQITAKLNQTAEFYGLLTKDVNGCLIHCR